MSPAPLFISRLSRGLRGLLRRKCDRRLRGFAMALLLPLFFYFFGDFFFQRFLFVVVVLVVDPVLFDVVELDVADVAGCGLQAVEDESGGLEVDLPGEQGIKNVADGELDAFGIFKDGNLEWGAQSRLTTLTLDPLARSGVEVAVVVVAES